jgi:hypothetical protein
MKTFALPSDLMARVYTDMVAKSSASFPIIAVQDLPHLDGVIRHKLRGAKPQGLFEQRIETTCKVVSIINRRFPRDEIS